MAIAVQKRLFPELEEETELTAETDKDLIILLDLNYTLVGNSWEKRGAPGDYAAKIRAEKYRKWLCDLVKGHTVLLCTVRHQRYEELTLKCIQAQLDWQPDGTYFNPDPDEHRGFIVKKAYLPHIFTTYGKPDERRYFAVESAVATRAMYAAAGIDAAPVPKGGIWTKLPLSSKS